MINIWTYLLFFFLYLKHIQFISAITYTCFMYDCKICITLSLLNQHGCQFYTQFKYILSLGLKRYTTNYNLFMKTCSVQMLIVLGALTHSLMEICKIIWGKTLNNL